MVRKILAIGHSFILAQNRDVFRHINSTFNIEVHIVAPEFVLSGLGRVEVEPEPEGSGIKLFVVKTYIPQRVHFFYYNLFDLQELLKKENYDAVYIWEEPYIVSGFSTALLCQLYKVPYFFFGCQNILKKYPFPISFLESQVQKKAACTFACGKVVQQVMVQKQYSQVEYLPFFVNQSRFSPLKAQDKLKQRELLGLQNQLTIGFMGRFVEEKGLRLFTEIADAVLAKNECNIIIIGSGPLQNEIQNWQKNKSNCVVVSLKHHEVPAVLAAIDVLLCPSQTRLNWKEQFGRMIVEAFASGVVVMGSDSGEIPYVIGDAGVVLPEQNIKAWVDALDQVLKSQDLRQDLMAKGFIRAQHFSVPVVAEQTLASINKSLQRMPVKAIS